MKSTALIASSVLLLTVVADLVCSLPIVEQPESDPQQILDVLPDLKAPIDGDLVKRDISSSSCIEWLYIIAFTSGIAGSGADNHHSASMRVSGETRPIILPNLPGDDYSPLKGDLWKLNLKNDFHFTDTCVQLHEIEYIAIEEHNNDGWNIESIVTFLRDDAAGAKYYQLATVDMEVNRWIDGDGHYDHRRFELSLVI